MQIKSNYLLKNITTLNIGGPARKFVSVATIEELIEAIKYAGEFLVIGGGSNLLVSDEGVDKLIIKNEIEGIEQEGSILKIKSGTILQDLVNYSIQNNLSGLQKLTGIPGTVGGAVYGNAGAYGQTISDHITQVVILNEVKNLKTLSKEECNFNYRDSIFKKTNEPILEITFQLETGDPKTMQEEANETLAKRLIKYPVGIKCPGSFFKNIVADTLPKEILDKVHSDEVNFSLRDKIVYGKLPAGALLEDVGAKGDSIDGIYIADYHANLFVNKGNGTAKAFYDLAKKYVNLVKEKFGITLEPEVQLINLPSLN